MGSSPTTANKKGMKRMIVHELPCLPLIAERYKNKLESMGIETKRIEITMKMFTQVWGSTALGFGGFGGSAMTLAYTTIVICAELDVYGVFFGNGMAYIIQHPNDIFFKDIENENLKAVYEANLYKK